MKGPCLRRWSRLPHHLRNGQRLACNSSISSCLVRSAKSCTVQMGSLIVSESRALARNMYQEAEWSNELPDYGTKSSQNTAGGSFCWLKAFRNPGENDCEVDTLRLPHGSGLHLSCQRYNQAFRPSRLFRAALSRINFTSRSRQFHLRFPWHLWIYSDPIQSDLDSYLHSRWHHWIYSDPTYSDLGFYQGPSHTQPSSYRSTSPFPTFPEPLKGTCLI